MRRAAQRGEFSRSLADASRKILPPPKPRSRQPNFTGPNSSSSVARDGSHSPSHLSLTRYPKGQAGVSRISPNRAFAQISLPNCFFVKGNLRRRGRAARWVLIFQFQDILWRTASCYTLRALRVLSIRLQVTRDAIAANRSTQNKPSRSCHESRCYDIWWHRQPPFLSNHEPRSPPWRKARPRSRRRSRQHQLPFAWSRGV